MRLPLFAAGSILLAAGCAHADTVQTYSVDTQSGKSSIGAVTINSTSGFITGFDVSLADNGTMYTFDGAPVSQSYNRLLNQYQATFAGGGDDLLFDLPVSMLSGYAPADRKKCATVAADCDYLANLYSGPASSADLTETFEGNLLATTLTSVTPEPTSIGLLGTGLLGIAALRLRRRA